MNLFPLTILISGIFFIFKLANVGVRLSDTNVYFYTAQELLKGTVLYKDIFFTNLPLFPYWSSLYTVFHSINFYYLTAAIEVVVSGLLIYYILWLKTKNSLLAFLGNVMYLGSFIILSTSDHQTGVFLATLLSLASYVLYLKNKRFLSGVFLGLTVCVKAYYLPILVAFIVYDVFVYRKKALKTIVGALTAIALTITPFIIFTFNEFVSSVFQYSLTRPQGIDKLPILIFFITKDFLLFLAFLFSLINFKKEKLIFLISIFSLLFVLFYKDVYYLYLNMVVPFLIISFINMYPPATSCVPTCSDAAASGRAMRAGQLIHVQLQQIFIGMVSVFILLNLFVYGNGYSSLQKVKDFDDMVLTIKKQKPPTIYGIEELTTALSYRSGVPLLNKIVDTNENLFNAGILKAKALTKKAVDQKALVVLKGATYPQQNINETALTSIVDKQLFFKHCFLLKKYPVTSEGVVNTITFFQCGQ